MGKGFYCSDRLWEACPTVIIIRPLGCCWDVSRETVVSPRAHKYEKLPTAAA